MKKVVHAKREREKNESFKQLSPSWNEFLFYDNDRDLWCIKYNGIDWVVFFKEKDKDEYIIHGVFYAFLNYSDTYRLEGVLKSYLKGKDNS